MERANPLQTLNNVALGFVSHGDVPPRFRGGMVRCYHRVKHFCQTMTARWGRWTRSWGIRRKRTDPVHATIVKISYKKTPEELNSAQNLCLTFGCGESPCRSGIPSPLPPPDSTFNFIPLTVNGNAEAARADLKKRSGRQRRHRHPETEGQSVPE